jgi:sulfur-carrier protein
VASVTLLYFAWVRDAIGLDSEQVELPLKCETPKDITAWLKSRGGGYAAAFADDTRIRCAVDQTMANLDAPIGAAREIAFFPPVTGG